MLSFVSFLLLFDEVYENAIICKNSLFKIKAILPSIGVILLQINHKIIENRFTKSDMHGIITKIVILVKTESNLRRYYMVKFAMRLSNDQIETFFNSIGKVKSVACSTTKAGMLGVTFCDKYGKLFMYFISDDSICSDFYKTSEDWKLYMLSIFGDEYFKQCGEKPVPNDFVDKLSVEEIKELLSKCEIFPYSIEEKEAFRVGTRRFRIAIAKENAKSDIIIGPHFTFCKGMSSLTERNFMIFFSEKFGMDFINYYIGVEKQKKEKMMEDFRKKCERIMQKKLNIMVRTVEKKGKENLENN